jgi:hypothetical protein
MFPTRKSAHKHRIFRMVMLAVEIKGIAYQGLAAAVVGLGRT